MSARVRSFAFAATALASAATALAQEPAAAKSALPEGEFAVRCGTLLQGDGTELRSVWLVVRDGKIASVSADAPPAGLPVLDASGKVVMPGLVAADSDLSGAADAELNVTPDALAVDAFDFERSLPQALQGGVTTAYLSPGRERLVSGQGAVVKLAGKDPIARVLADAVCLRINVGDGAVSAPRVFEPTAHPTSDEPLEPSRVQTPTARISVLAELRALFARATDGANGPQGTGLAEDRYTEQALASVVRKELPLRAAAVRAHDVRRALQLQRELGVRMVLENPQEIGALAGEAAAQGVAATFRLPVLLGRRNPGGEDRRQKLVEPRPDAPALAAAAGMTIALGQAPGSPLRDFLVSAALAVRHGLPVAAAVRAVTGDAAKLLGVDARVGSLLPGKDADFLVLSGAPFAIGTMVEATYVDGKPAWERKTKSNALAVRCARILDAEGRVFRDGTILVQDGRILAVGEDLAVPYGARVVTIPGGVMTPGFVDAFSHLGLAGDGTSVPNGTAAQRVHEAAAHDDPMFAPALAEGITTVLLSGKDAGPIAGRVAALKTGARDRSGFVVREIVGLRTAHDAIGPDASKPLSDLLGRGKQYLETWRAYEKAYTEWKTGKPAEPAAQPAPQPPAGAAVPAADDPVSGTWKGTVEVQDRPIEVTLELTLEGAAVKGRIRVTFGTREVPPQDVQSGSFTGGVLKLEFRWMGQSGTFEGKVENDKLAGKLGMGPLGEQDFTAVRTQKGGAQAPVAQAPPSPETKKGEEPKKPAVDESLEPLRAVLEKRAALVVRTNRAPAIADVVALLEKEQVPYVLHGGDGILDDPKALGGKKPSVLLEPDVVTEDDGELTNAAAKLAELDVPIVFGTGDCAGARHLPLHAAYAVRYGLSPHEALRAVTSNAARAFALDDRIGSLRKGKDADFVVFSGDPFEPTSRVLLVVCNGEIAVDRREVAK